MNGLSDSQAAYEAAPFGTNVDVEDAYDSYLMVYARCRDAAWEAYLRDVDAGAADPRSRVEWERGEDDRPDDFGAFAERYQDDARETAADAHADEAWEKMRCGD